MENDGEALQVALLSVWGPSSFLLWPLKKNLNDQATQLPQPW